MIHTKESYRAPVIDYSGPKRQGKTVPDQAMSVQEIVRRFVRGVPVNIVQREAVYIDQSDHDLEKLSRMDFAEKAEFAKGEAERLKQWKSDLIDEEREKKENERRAKEESDAKAAAAKAGGIVVP